MLYGIGVKKLSISRLLHRPGESHFASSVGTRVIRSDPTRPDSCDLTAFWLDPAQPVRFRTPPDPTRLDPRDNRGSGDDSRKALDKEATCCVLNCGRLIGTGVVVLLRADNPVVDIFCLPSSLNGRARPAKGKQLYCPLRNVDGTTARHFRDVARGPTEIKSSALQSGGSKSGRSLRRGVFVAGAGGRLCVRRASCALRHGVLLIVA